MFVFLINMFRCYIYVFSFSCEVQTEGRAGVLAWGTMLLQCSCGLECPELKSKLPDHLALLLFQGFTAASTFGASTAQVDEDVHKYAKTIKGEKGTPLHIKVGLSLWPSDRGEIFKYFLWSAEAKLKLCWHILLLVGKRSEMPSALKRHPPQLGIKRWWPILPLVREVTRITDAISQYGLKGIQTRITIKERWSKMWKKSISLLLTLDGGLT